MPGEVLVQMRLATICGSDLHTLKGLRTEPVPAILGHEGVGVVTAMGEPRKKTSEEPNEDRPLEIGDRVTWSIADSCGHCVFCTTYGLPEKCRTVFKYGHAALSNGSGLNGCYASHILLRPGTHICRPAESLPDAVVAPANCALATAINAISSIRPDQCHTALVQGAGLVGLYTCALLVDKGVKRVFCVDVDEGRLAIARRFGATPVVGGEGPYSRAKQTLEEAAPWGLDAVIEAAGVSSLVPEGIRLLRPGGYYGFVGMVHPATQLEGVTGEQIIRKCLTIRGVHNYAPRHLDQAMAFLERTASRYPYESLVSPPFALKDLAEAVSTAEQRQYLRVSVGGGR
jgi:putative phosphonate catabolism associated alcohol dehydrogenase